LKTLNLRKKLRSLVSAKNNERCPRVDQSGAVIAGKQSPKRSGLAVPIRADHHKG
jgi:hypothetical protein